MISGAIQYGVPTRDLLLGTSCVTWAQKPKSDILTYKINPVKNHIKFSHRSSAGRLAAQNLPLQNVP